MRVCARFRDSLLLLVLAAGGPLTSLTHAAAAKVATEQVVVPPDAQQDDEVGWAVALDGDTVLVGADTDSRVVADGGAAFVYSGFATPVLQATLTASDAAAGDNFGVSVAVDGDAVLVGAFHRFAPTPGAGKAYVFRRTGSSWSEETKLVAPDGQNNDAFGWAAAIDGDIAVLGAPRAWSGSPAGGGGVYVFERVDGTWTFDTKLSRSGEYAFGWSVAFDGKTLVVGAPLGPSSSPGRAFVYERDLDGTWLFRQQLAPTDLGAFAEFGNAVGVAGTGIVVGAWFNSAGGAMGSAYFFEASGGTWTQAAKFDAPGGAGAETFGEAVAIDGDRALVTDSGLDVDGTEDLGAVYLFQRAGSAWKPAGALQAGDGETGDYFGMAAALEGARLVVGAPYRFEPAAQTMTGAAYLLHLAAPSRLAVKNAVPDNESMNAIQARMKGPGLEIPFPGSPDDPTCLGSASSSLEIASLTSGAGFSQTLPCANWAQTLSGYRYRDPELDDGPCKDVYFRANGSLSMRCSGRGPSILDFDLEPGVVQAPVVVRLTLGSQSLCATFGGTVQVDGTDGRKLVVTNGTALQACAAP